MNEKPHASGLCGQSGSGNETHHPKHTYPAGQMAQQEHVDGNNPPTPG